jgi:hypothetical protein
MFNLNRHGNPGGRCPTCRRWGWRLRAKRQWRLHREKLRAKRKEHYWRNPERWRAARRAYYLRRKLAA